MRSHNIENIENIHTNNHQATGIMVHKSLN
jgi:hypothetical protein